MSRILYFCTLAAVSACVVPAPAAGEERKGPAPQLWRGLATTDRQVIRLQESRSSVVLRCSVKKCCKRLSKSRAVEQRVFIDQHQQQASSLCSSNNELRPRWSRWSPTQRRWLPIQMLLSNAPESRGNRLRLRGNSSAGLVGFYRCALLPEDVNTVTAKECQDKVIRVKRRNSRKRNRDPKESQNTEQSPRPERQSDEDHETASHAPQAAAPFMMAGDVARLVSRDDTTTIPCRAGGYPRPVITWLRGYTAIDFSKNTHLKQLSNGSLQFSPVSKSDQDTYRCVADNRYGHAYSTNKIWIR